MLKSLKNITSNKPNKIAIAKLIAITSIVYWVVNCLFGQFTFLSSILLSLRKLTSLLIIFIPGSENLICLWGFFKKPMIF